jgi:glucose-1-phosphate thymidylyltransferase
MGSSDDFLNCSQFVRTIQKRQGLLVCSPHEIAYRNGWIEEKNLLNYIKTIENSEYSENLLKVLESE